MGGSMLLTRRPRRRHADCPSLAIGRVRRPQKRMVHQVFAGDKRGGWGRAGDSQRAPARRLGCWRRRPGRRHQAPQSRDLLSPRAAELDGRGAASSPGGIWAGAMGPRPSSRGRTWATGFLEWRIGLARFRRKAMRRHGAKNADYRGGVTCLYDTQLLGACLHASESGGRSRPEAVRGMPDVPIAPPATGPNTVRPEFCCSEFVIAIIEHVCCRHGQQMGALRGRPIG